MPPTTLPMAPAPMIPIRIAMGPLPLAGAPRPAGRPRAGARGAPRPRAAWRLRAATIGQSIITTPAMTYDFDRLVDRRRTDSSKWQKYGPDVLPLWVADMDFQSPEPVIRALRERVEHGVFGYLAFEQPEFHELFAD